MTDMQEFLYFAATPFGTTPDSDSENGGDEYSSGTQR